MSVALSGKLVGVVDRFSSPRTLSGWAINSDRASDGRDILICVRIAGRKIGQDFVSFPRPDLIDKAGYVAGFRVECTEDIQPEAIAFGLLSIEATDSNGRSAEISISEGTKEMAFTRVLLRLAPPASGVNVATILTWLAKSPALTSAASEALTLCRDNYIETSVSPANPGIPADTRVLAADESLNENERIRQLMCHFESLGHDCTLGSIQRHFGAEPLGLMRFTGVGIKSVVSALRDRLSGIGAPDFTRLTKQDNDEYMSFDTRYHMASHTFVFEGEVVFDHFYGQHCRKLSYLARNLLEDIEEGKKILVIHALPEEISDSDLKDLQGAVRAIGPAVILYLRAATEANPSGTLVRHDERLLYGYVLQSGPELMKPYGAVCDSWLSICSAAHGMVVDARPDTVPLQTGT